MKKLRVCIGSNDGKTVADSHLGDVQDFYVYDIFENSKKVFVDKKTNVFKDFGHSSGGKMKSILQLVEDAEIMSAYQMSPNFKNMAIKTAHQPVVVKEKDFETVLDILCENFDMLLSLVEKRKNGEFSEEIPIFTGK